MDERTDELRPAHDTIAELYAELLANHIDRTPEDRAVLGLFRDLIVERDGGTVVGDIGCGSGQMAGYLAPQAAPARRRPPGGDGPRVPPRPGSGGS